jgi:hypothetical protein
MNTEKLRILKTDEEIKVFSDPYRLRIIHTYYTEKKPLTAKQAADLMKEEPAKVAYHVKKLLAINILALDHTESINGIQAKFYRLTSEHFKIKYQNTDILDKEWLRNQANQLYFTIIDEHKKIFDSTIQETNNRQHHVDKGRIMRETLYLTETQAVEIEQMILNLLEKYTIKKSNTEEYEMLVSMIRKS